jgi:hypothetical protein
MLINILSSIKNYKNSKLLLISANFIAAAILIGMIGSGVSFNNNDDDEGNFFGSFNIKNSNRVYAQQQQQPYNRTIIIIKQNYYCIKLCTIMPLTNPIYNQLKVIVQYKTNDASLLNTKANGLRVFSLNGTIIKTSSFPNGFLLNQTGSIQFATSFTDKSLQNVKADVVLTDLSKINPLSNLVTTNISLNNTVK